jgi:hypothetical protein
MEYVCFNLGRHLLSPNLPSNVQWSTVKGDWENATAIVLLIIAIGGGVGLAIAGSRKRVSHVCGDFQR